MDELRVLESLGFRFANPACIFGIVVFSLLGWVGCRYNKQATNVTTKWLGVALMP